MSLVREAIALGGAAGRIGLSAFNPAAFQCRVEVVLAKSGSMRQPHCLHEVRTADFTASNGLDQLCYLVGYLVGGNGFVNCIK